MNIVDVNVDGVAKWVTIPQLKAEAELRFQDTTVTMPGNLEGVKGAFCGNDPRLFLNIEDHLQSRLARSSLITMDDRSPDDRAPGPKIFFGSEKQIVSGNQSAKLSTSTALESR
ncbi:hypothetical protein HPB47_026826 [Ixodes persulcatus]|uniref:Uncharacterized protein n=1 Tax=Ixodes persulcatus TaxID=34615 RepID=A0AC60PZ96_IXOPE|nr:hypothetical protein HPB47_026826 [Ixodes persulcatus]